MAQYTSPKTKAQIIALKSLEYSDWAIVQLLQPETQASHATVGSTSDLLLWPQLRVEYQQQQTLNSSTSLLLGPLLAATTSKSWVYNFTNAAKCPC
ncbi:hypothetical protein RhiXN_06838 [Rhizoctonia solani]|uniref:Uncharacterized protein n=1 Tax=Rhizoctonia solani TaxID=456999 RepID=A0A8H8SXT5_9AGAM|nr:uncharacterized protein RhiXN_06838 [Rhizoctonia solani]QRW21849.1 hypothetical protein RhiXN_06838 [Rhizoctonia solani]